MESFYNYSWWLLNFVFQPYALGYRIYKTRDEEEAILLIRKAEFGNKDSYQKEMQFEEFGNSRIFVKKNSDS